MVEGFCSVECETKVRSSIPRRQNLMKCTLNVLLGHLEQNSLPKYIHRNWILRGHFDNKAQEAHCDVPLSTFNIPAKRL